MNKTYELPLTRNYVRNWTVVEAVREILQNAIDYGNGKLRAELNSNSHSIWIHSEGARLEPRTLLLGCTSKADDSEAIGSFGEGYKIALLVLAREGVEVTVHNREVVWNPFFRQSETFGEEVLCIDEWPLDQPSSGVSFAIPNLYPEVFDKIIENTLQLQDNFGKFHRVNEGDILLDRPGKLYVNGLFVTDTGLEYGYNIKPEFLKLERDRQTVSSFDLKWMTKTMWFGTGLFQQVSELMEKGVEDLEYGQYDSPELLKDACYKIFREKHPGAVVAKSQAELEALVKEGLIDVRIYPESFANTVASHPEYQVGIVRSAKLSPQGELKAFAKTQKPNMNRKAKEAFNGLIDSAKNWKH